MNILLNIFINLAGSVSGILNEFFSTFQGVETVLIAGSGAVLAFAIGAVTYSDIPEGILSIVRRWHGSIDDQFKHRQHDQHPHHTQNLVDRPHHPPRAARRRPHHPPRPDSQMPLSDRLNIRPRTPEHSPEINRRILPDERKGLGLPGIRCRRTDR
jgi:hypothetical protein